jgi:hypothetical protein
MSINAVGNSSYLKVWAYGQDVSEPEDERFENGYVGGERPPASEHNHLWKSQATTINHILKNGVPEWDSAKTYQIGDYTKSSGVVYKAVVSSSNSQPTSSNTNWAALALVSDLDERLKRQWPSGPPPYVANDNIIVTSGGLQAYDKSSGEFMIAPDDIPDVDIRDSGVNGLDTGSASINTWYYMWLIKNPSNGLVRCMLSLSNTSPTMPAGYLHKALVCPILRRTRLIHGRFSQFGSGSIVWHNNEAYSSQLFIDPGPVMVARDLQNTSWTDLDISAFVPPESRMADVYLRLQPGYYALRNKGSTKNGEGFSSNMTSNIARGTVHTDDDRVIQYIVSSGADMEVNIEGWHAQMPYDV